MPYWRSALQFRYLWVTDAEGLKLFDVTHLDRPFLHAAHLVFQHPEDGRKMEFLSAMPADLQRVLDELRERFDAALHEP